MPKMYHLSTCDTCRAVIKALDNGRGFELQDIKPDSISPDELDQLVEIAGSHEALFSRKARKYRELGLANATLTEADYRKLMLEEYTFLKRPLILVGRKLFIGNSEATLADVRLAMQQLQSEQ